MAVSITEVVLLSLITIDGNFTVDVKNWTRWGCFPGLAGLFYFEKIQSTHTSLEPQEQSYNSCIKAKLQTLINVMEGSHTYYCVAHPYYNCHWLFCNNMKGNHVSVHNNSSNSCCIDMKRLYEM